KGVDARKNLQQCRLTGAVFAAETHDLAAANLEVGAGERLDTAEALLDVDQAQQGALSSQRLLSTRPSMRSVLVRLCGHSRARGRRSTHLALDRMEVSSHAGWGLPRGTAARRNRSNFAPVIRFAHDAGRMFIDRVRIRRLRRRSRRGGSVHEDATTTGMYDVV